MPQKPTRRAFILVVVIGLLGVMAFLAVNLVSRSRSFKELSVYALQDAKAVMLARSGIDLKREQLLGTFQTGGTLATPITQASSLTVHTFNASQTGTDIAEAWAMDLTGAINLNDGIRAGQLELAGGYQSNAVDPWPADSLNPAVFVDDKSAQCNLRLRRLLNAYGDAHKFAGDIGWPNTAAPVVGGVPDGANYGQPFTFTSTAIGSRYKTMPGVDSTGMPLLTPATIAASSTGFGDRLIAARPNGGWMSLEDVKDIIDQWAADFLSAGYLGTSTFFEMVRGDLTVLGWEDKSFFRMNREFGRDRDGDSYPDFQGDTTWNRMTPRGQSNKNIMEFFETAPPDMSNMWESHSVSVINLNSASDFVRAAVFYAPVNVSYVAEGAGHDGFRWDLWLSNGAAGTSSASIHSSRESLGTSGPVFKAAKMRENGIAVNAPNNPGHPNVQRHRLMSLRDAMMLAQAYREWSSDSYGLGTTWPDSFEMFRKALTEINANAQPYERAEFSSYMLLDEQYLGKQSYFDQQYLEVTLPQILSCQRRLPGWMQAPIALMSPYIGQAAFGLNLPFYAPSSQNKHTFAKRSAEDFVFRHHIPKVTFMPTGYFKIGSKGTWTETSIKSEKIIEGTFHMFRTQIFRTQDQFVNATDPASDPSVLIGPEPSGVNPSPFLGTVGLRDRGEIIPGGGLASPSVDYFRMDFDGNLQPHNSSTIKPMDSLNDIEIGTGGWDQFDLRGSELEDENVSLFETGSSGSNLSPFGGLILDSRGHGPRATDRFNDSLYFRPQTQLMAADNLIGTKCNEGSLSVWVRVPSGYHYHGRRKNIFHMTLWEQFEVRTTNLINPPTTVGGEPTLIKSRPVTMTGSLFTKALQTSNSASGSTHDVEFTHIVGNTSKGGLITGLIPTYFYDIATTGTLTTIPFPFTSAAYTTGQSLYGNTMGSYYSIWNTSAGGLIPLLDWHRLQTEHVATLTAPGPVYTPDLVQTNLETMVRHQLYPNLNGTDPYLMRQGGWQRLTFKWDFTNQRHPRARQIMVVPPETWNFGHWEFWPGMEFGIYPIMSRVQNGIFNPKMLLSFGERADPLPDPTANLQNDHPGNIFTATGLNRGDIVPFERLNSSIDNIVLTFGRLPNANFAADFTNDLGTPDEITRIKDAVETIVDFDSMRYEVKSEPRWVINAGLPVGSRLLTFGARIFDVPFRPDYGGQWAVWDWKSPAIGLKVEDALAPVTSPKASDPIVGSNIVYKSPAWQGYGNFNTTAQTRYVVTWRTEDPNGAPMGKVLSDIPWIEDLSWRYVPPGPTPILSWQVR